MVHEVEFDGRRSPAGDCGGGGGLTLGQNPKLPPSAAAANGSHGPIATTAKSHHEKQPITKAKKLTVLPLMFLIYFEVSGGPYASEPTVRAAGPLLALVGFLVFPFIWCLPEALVTAELATALPGDGGFVHWAHLAFGPFIGTIMGTWKFFSGVVNTAAFPALFVNYLSRAVPSVANNPRRNIATVAFTLGLSFISYTGIQIVGYAAVVLGLVSLMPFVLMTGFAIPKLRPRRWLSRGSGHRDWRLYLNTLYWNLNYWDNASTMAGEVEQPQRAFPKALLSAGLLTCLGYLVPLMAAIGALDVAQEQWEDGFFADAAGMIGGKWLKLWIEIGATLSAMGLYEAQLSSNSFQLLGMADLGLLPSFCATRSRWFDTPWVGILISTAVSLAMSFMSFDQIVAAANFLYSMSMLLEFASFIWLRRKHPELHRPFKVPLGLPGLVCMCLVPTVFLLVVMALASWTVYVIGAGLTVLGVAMYYSMGFCRSRGYLEFSKVENSGTNVVSAQEEAAAGGIA